MSKNKKTKSKADVSAAAGRSGAAPQLSTYRVLAFQPLSVNLAPQTIDLKIEDVPCKVSIRAAQPELSLQLQEGGSLLAIEFADKGDEDLFVAARKGLSMLESFLSALAIVVGSTFRASELLQVAQLESTQEAQCEFLILKKLPVLHWGKPISGADIGKVKHLLAHWDGLDDGHRLRRAALQYREAIGTADDASAFQEAYMGLEAMEPPLAKAIGLTPGTEEVKGKCEACGHEFTRKRTTLVGVRAFVLDAPDVGQAEPERAKDWKLINKLRTDLVHGLIDQDALGDRPHRALLAAMHHLHAAICLMSHAKELVTDKFLLARGGPTYLIWGTYTAASWAPLHEWGEALEFSEFSWVPHEQYGHVPQISFKNEGLKDLELVLAQLAHPLAFATMGSIKPVRAERD